MTFPRLGAILLGLACNALPAAAQMPEPPSAAGACEIVGPVLSPSDFNVPAGQPVADASAVLLPDGRIRIYVFAQGRGVVSAVSVSTDGLSFIAEPGNRLPDGSGMPRAVPNPAGGWRLFFISADGIRSAVTTDGLTFRVEEGFRITAQAAGFGGTTAGATSGATVVTLPDGRYRMYFSDLPRPGDPPGHHYIRSAISTDQLAWTVEDGVRVGPGAAAITESSEHPFALANPDGTVTLYYGRFGGAGSGGEGVYHSTSTDGLTFETETFDVTFGNDPDVVRLADGTVLMYYGQFDPQVGGTINVARCPDPTAVGGASSGPKKIRTAGS